MNPELAIDSPNPDLAPVAATRPLYWAVRRELWEYRSIYIAPLAVASLFLFGFLISMFRFPEKMRAALALDPIHQAGMIQQPYDLAALVIMGATFIVSIFYCLESLHAERRDRSILFWKSLPVSDRTTVLSKATVPLVILPLLTFVITVVTQWMMLLLSSAALLANGMSIATLWKQLPMFQMSLLLFAHLVVVHGLYYAPIWGWLMLVSGWARRAVILWAALPPLAIGVVEKIAFGTSHFAAMLGSRVSGGTEAVVFPAPGLAPMQSMSHGTPLELLISPAMLIGLAVAALFLAAAVRVRRYREPI